MEPVFVEGLPPALRHPKEGYWKQTLKPLIGRPGVWAIIAQYEGERSRIRASNMAGNLNRAISFPSGEWEFASRMVNEIATVYARYVGPNN